MSIVQARHLTYQLDTLEELYTTNPTSNSTKITDILTQIDNIISSNLSSSYVLLPPQTLLRFIEKSLLLNETRHLAEQHLALFCQITQPSGICEIKAHILWGQLLADKANDDKFLFDQKTKVLSKAIDHLSTAQKMILQPHHGGRYDFLTFNLSRTIYKILRVHFRTGYLSAFANLSEQIIKALTENTESDYDWKGLFNWLFLYCLRDAGRERDFDEELTRLWATSRKRGFSFQESLFRLRVATISDKKKLADLQREVEKDRKLSAILTLQALRSGIIDEASTEITVNNLLKSLMPNTGDVLSAESQWVSDLLAELARICARLGNEKTATKILEYLKRSKSSSPTSILLIELTKVDLLLYSGQRPDTQTGQVSCIFDLEKRHEALNILQKILRIKLVFNPLLIYETCLMVWNVSLPLLNETRAKELLKPFLIASKLLEEIESNDCSLRIRFHFELTKIYLSLKSERTGLTDFTSLKNAKTNIVRCRELLHFDENSFDKNKIYVLLENIKMLEGSSKHGQALTVQTFELKLKSFRSNEAVMSVKELVHIGSEIRVIVGRMMMADRASVAEEVTVSDFQILLRSFDLMLTTLELLAGIGHPRECLDIANSIVSLTDFKSDFHSYFDTLCRQSQELSVIRVNSLLLRASSKIKSLEQQGHSFAHVQSEPLPEVDDLRDEIASDFECSANLAVLIKQKWLVFNVGVAFWNAYLPVFRTEDQSKQIHPRILQLLKSLFLGLRQTILLMEKSKVVNYDSELSVQIFCNISLVYIKVLEKEGEKGKEMSKEVIDVLLQIKVPPKIRKDVNKVLSKGIGKTGGIGSQSDQFLFEISSKLESAVGMEVGHASKVGILSSVFEQLQNYNGETDKEVLMEMYIKLASIAFNEKTVQSVKLCLASVTCAKGIFTEAPKSALRLMSVACLLEAKSLHLLVESGWVSETKSEDLLSIALESALNFATFCSRLSSKKSVDIIKRFCIILNFIRSNHWTERIKSRVVELVFQMSGLLLDNSENFLEMLSDLESSMLVSNMLHVMREASSTQEHWKLMVSAAKSALLYLNNQCKDQVWGIYVLGLTNVGEVRTDTFGLFQECGTKLQAEILQIIAMTSNEELLQFKAFEKSLELMKREGSMDVLQIIVNFANWMLTKSFPREKVVEFVGQIEEVVAVIDDDQSRVFVLSDLLLQMSFLKLKLVDGLAEEGRLVDLIVVNCKKIIEIVKSDGFEERVWFRQPFVTYLELVSFLRDKMTSVSFSQIEVVSEVIKIVAEKIGGRFESTGIYLEALYLFKSDQFTRFEALVPTLKLKSKELTEDLRHDVKQLTSGTLDSNSYLISGNKVNHPPLVFLYMFLSDVLVTLDMTDESLELAISLHFICQERKQVEFLGLLKIIMCRCLMKRKTVEDVEGLLVQAIPTLTQVREIVTLQDLLVEVLISGSRFKETEVLLGSFEKQLSSVTEKSKKLSPLLISRARLNLLLLRIKLGISKFKKFNQTSMLEPPMILRETIKRSTQEIVSLLIESLILLRHSWEFDMCVKVNGLAEEFFGTLIEAVPSFELDLMEIIYILLNSLFLVHVDFLKTLTSAALSAGIEAPSYLVPSAREGSTEVASSNETKKNIDNVLAEQALATMSSHWTISNIKQRPLADSEAGTATKSHNMVFVRLLISAQLLNANIGREVLVVEKKFKRNSVCFPMSLEVAFYEKFFHQRKIQEDFITENGLGRHLLGSSSPEDEFISRQCVERSLAITNFAFKRIIWIETLLVMITEEREREEFEWEVRLVSGFYSQLAWENNLLLDFTNTEIRQAFHITEADTDLKSQLKEEDMKRLRKIPEVSSLKNISVKNFLEQCLRISENKAFFPFDREDELVQFSNLLLYQKVKSLITSINILREESHSSDKLVKELKDTWTSRHYDKVESFLTSSPIFSNLKNVKFRNDLETLLPLNSLVVALQVDTIGFEVLLGLSVKGADQLDVTSRIFEVPDSQSILQHLSSHLRDKERRFLNQGEEAKEVKEDWTRRPTLTRHEFKILKKNNSRKKHRTDIEESEEVSEETSKPIFEIFENEELLSGMTEDETEMYRVMRPMLETIASFLVEVHIRRMSEFESKVDPKKKVTSGGPPSLALDNLFIIVDSGLVRIPLERLVTCRLGVPIQKIYKDLSLEGIVRRIKKAEEISLSESLYVSIDKDTKCEYVELTKLNSMYTELISKQVSSDSSAFISCPELQNMFKDSSVLFYRGLAGFLEGNRAKDFFSVVEESRMAFLCVLDKIHIEQSSFEIFKNKFERRSLHKEFRVYLSFFVLLDMTALVISEGNLTTGEIEGLVATVSQTGTLGKVIGAKLLAIGCAEIVVGKEKDKKKAK